MTAAPSLPLPDRGRKAQRRLVIESTRLLLARLPLDEVTIPRVADEAGLTIADVERVGSSPGKLLVLAYNDGLAETVGAAIDAAEPIESPAPAVAAFVETIVRAILSVPHRTAYQHELVLGEADDRMREVAFGSLDRVPVAVGDILRSRCRAPAPVIADLTAQIVDLIFVPLGEPLSGGALDAAVARIAGAARDVVAAADLG